MKSLKMVLAIALLSSMMGGSAFAQSRMRGDEIIQNPQEYRLGDSDDLQGDEMKIEQICNDDKAVSQDEKAQSPQMIQQQQRQNHLMQRRSLKHSDYI